MISNHVITGASSGVGAAAARLLARPDRHLWLLARRAESLHALAEALRRDNCSATALPCDVADPAAGAQASNPSGDRGEGLGNAAARPAGDVANSAPALIARVVMVNLVGTMLCAREAAARMGSGGTIVNLGSLCNRVRDNGASLYVATKAGVAGFTDSLRKEVAPRGIRVVLLNPGQIASGMVTETEDEKRAAGAREAMLTPEEVAAAIRHCIELPDRIVVTEMELRPRGQAGL